MTLSATALMGLKVVKETTPTLCPGNRQGFSLLEIIVVVVLMAAASAIVLPSFSGAYSGLQVETAGRDLATVMKQARSYAVGRQHPYRVLLSRNVQSGESHEYVLADEFGRSLKAFPLPEGIQFVGEQSYGRPMQDMVSFYPSGRSSGGDFYLRNERGKTVRVSVDPITGFSVVQTLEDPTSN